MDENLQILAVRKLPVEKTSHYYSIYIESYTTQLKTE